MCSSSYTQDVKIVLYVKANYGQYLDEINRYDRICVHIPRLMHMLIIHVAKVCGLVHLIIILRKVVQDAISFNSFVIEMRLAHCIVNFHWDSPVNTLYTCFVEMN